MEFLAESIGLLDMDGGSSSGFATPKNKPAHVNANTDTSFSSMIGINNDRTQSQSSALQSPIKCDRCSKKTFNLALENLSDMESCQCDCQRSYYNNSDDLDDGFNSEFDVDDVNCDGELKITKAAHTNDTSCSEEEDSIANESKPQSSLIPDRINTITDSSQLTRLVTQRIDARTNYNCFTGKVDALTGEIIHGLLVYRVTGEVYEGPFVSVPRQNNQSLSFSLDYSMAEGGNIDNSTKEFATVSLRHGSNATSHHPNGMTFTGSYEYDVPKYGKWIMKDNDGDEEWMYEGPLIEVRIDADGSEPSLSGSIAALSPRGRSPSLNSVSITSPPSSGNLSAASLSSNRVIGISTPLPGSVLFHGNGTFTRYSDGMRYKGEFDFGLAHGVGKEIIPNIEGVGESVYQGEFANGFRHGVGTLIEDVVIEDDERGYDERGDYCEHCNRILFVANEEFNTDNGPDFAAGCSNQYQYEESHHLVQDGYNAQDNDITTTPCSRCMEQVRRPIMKKQMKSGVWCAGQFEVQDVVGVVHHTSDGNKEFVEDTSPFDMPAGTTWDLLPEKWLGLG